MCLEKCFLMTVVFNKELYVGGADILITTRSFTDILTEYYNYLENMQLTCGCQESDKISLLLFWLF